MKSFLLLIKTWKIVQKEETIELKRIYLLKSKNIPEKVPGQCYKQGCRGRSRLERGFLGGAGAAYFSGSCSYFTVKFYFFGNLR